MSEGHEAISHSFETPLYPLGPVIGEGKRTRGMENVP